MSERMARALLLSLVWIAVGCGDDGETTASTGTATSTATGTASSGASGGSGTTTDGGTTDALPAGMCLTQDQCENGASCDPPGTVFCGGATGCALDGVACVDDGACGGSPGAPAICVTDPCCQMGICQPGCLGDAECGSAAECGADGRCVPAPCDAMSPCPADFTCTAGLCARASCGGGVGCVGYCVLGLCYASPGNCNLPAA
jgi:hypothetical protein